MLALLTALAEALPAAGKFVDALSHTDEKASNAAKVAADPAAPKDVKDAANRVATKAIEDNAAVQKQALQEVTGQKAPAKTDNIGTLVLVGLGMFLLSRRR